MPYVTVGPLPPWMPVDRLLGEGWRVSVDGVTVSAERELDREAAADVLARLRGLAFGGLDLQIRVRPPLKRPQVRAGRTREARARRDTSPGFVHRGTRLDEEGRLSLTPEALALRIGEASAGRRVLDLTCGAGGNAIGFARAGCTVIAVERDRERLEDARHNARLYEVADRITFVHGDAREQVDQHDVDVIFIDPPWGGYDHRVAVLDDLPLLAELLPRLPPGPALQLKLPPSFDPATLPFPVRVEPLFGEAGGDWHRVKCLWVHRIA